MNAGHHQINNLLSVSVNKYPVFLPTGRIHGLVSTVAQFLSACAIFHHLGVVFSCLLSPTLTVRFFECPLCPDLAITPAD